MIALLIPGLLAQAVAVLLFHSALTAVAQAMFAVNLVLLVASLLPAVLTLARRARVRGPYSGWAVARRWLPGLGSEEQLEAD